MFLIFNTPTRLQNWSRNAPKYYYLTFQLSFLIKSEFYIFSKPVEPDRLFECLPNSMRPSSGSPGHQESSGKNRLSNSIAEQNGAENAVFTPPTLIPPRILPLLHDLAQQMVQAGHQQQFVKIYR